jgi:predicted nucleic acid-binding protein
MSAGFAVVSPQVIVEYFDVTTRPRGILPPIFSKDDALRAVEALLASCRCLDLTPITAFEAARAASRYQMRIFDAHIWAAARLNGIETILTEDAQSRATIEGVTYVNLFAPNFTPSQIGL